jgi:hypothetical protein
VSFVRFVVNNYLFQREPMADGLATGRATLE